MSGIINISKPSEYLLNSITINTSATSISGSLYVNNFYCTGESKILTGNGVDWYIISPADFISISNTTLSDSNASGTSFYAYESNGNIDSGNNTIWIFDDPLQITNLSINSGMYGTEIIITGTSFSDNPVVTFNGVPAIIESSTSTQIITHVPYGATTGHIFVDGYESVETFTALPPIITDISPLHGPVGTEIAITGQYFYIEPIITFYNNIVATNESWSETQVLLTVPFGATTGYMTISFDGNIHTSVMFTLGWAIVCSDGIINVKHTEIYDSNAYGGAMFKSYITNGCIDGGNNNGWIFSGYDPSEHKRRTDDPLTKYQITVVDTTGKSGS